MMTTHPLLFVLALALLLGLVGEARGAEPPPNFVVLMADDLGYGDLGSYGHPAIRTPNLDRLAAGGQRWTDFYVAAPVCSPSRGALLTGRYPVRTGLYGDQIGVFFPGDPGGIPETELTLAEALRDAGYATAIVGKWHLGDAAHALPTRHGFDYWQGLPYSNDMDWADGIGIDAVRAMRAAGQTEALLELRRARQKQYFQPASSGWNVPLMESRCDSGGACADRVLERPARQEALTRRATEAAVAFMTEHQDAPFFLYVPYSMPHTPLFRSEAFAERSIGGRYGDVVEELDWSVGEIVNALDGLGLRERTLVLFTSDNGPWLLMNSHGGSAGLLRQGKATTFEGGMRVPLIASRPGWVAPGVVSALGSTLDVFATVAALAGIETPTTDGFDLSPVFLGSSEGSREEIAYYRGSELRAYRQGPWKLHLITEGAYNQPPPRVVHEQPQLYHLGEDPGERFDVSAQYPDVVARLEAAIARHRTSTPVAEPIMDKRLGEGG